MCVCVCKAHVDSIYAPVGNGASLCACLALMDVRAVHCARAPYGDLRAGGLRRGGRYSVRATLVMTRKHNPTGLWCWCTSVRILIHSILRTCTHIHTHQRHNLGIQTATQVPASAARSTECQDAELQGSQGECLLPPLLEEMRSTLLFVCTASLLTVFEYCK